jgi:hydrogenase-4 component B
VFGVLMITAQILPNDHAWGYLLLVLGCITMVLGALIAVFSVNLKHIFACSSLSQIGFITVGISMICLLGHHNALAANGTVLYMMNHSLVKLVLFLFAGAVYMNAHSLDLNDLRGFGRGKPLLHILYLVGAGSLAGIPGLCGYISKTLVHESIVEYIAESGSFAITLVEWLFLFSGGLTTAYLTKVYVALFWQKPSADAHHSKRWGTPLTVAALCIAAITLPVLGLLPHSLAERLTLLTLDFTGGHNFSHAVHYLAWVNLKGVVISVGIGLAVYFLFIARVLIRGKGEAAVYLSLWPAWLSLEDSVYRPLCHKGFRLLKLVCRFVCDLPDAVILLLRRTVLHPIKEKVNDHPHSRHVRILARRRGHSHEDMSDHLATSLEAAKRLEGSLSFSLLMACIGLCAVLVFVVVYVFC